MRAFGLILSFCISLALALLMGEGIVRLAGHSPWTAIPRFDGIPAVTQPDAELGWVNRPGHYRFSAVPGSPAVEVTVNPDGSRKTGDSGPVGASIWITGCSLTYGWGVGDADTYSAVASNELAAKGWGKGRVANLGVAGYGTLQTWQLFKRHAKSGAVPRLVLYGFFEGHAERNLALPSFTRVLDRAASQQAWVKMPYARVDATTAGIKLYPPAGYSRWPGAAQSALINLAQESWDRIVQRRVEPYGDAVTMELIKAYARDVEATGAKFVVLILYLSDEKFHFRDDLKRNGIAYLDLTNMGFPGPDTTIIGDGHPNALMHARWGKRVAAFLEQELTPVGAAGDHPGAAASQIASNGKDRFPSNAAPQSGSSIGR